MNRRFFGALGVVAVFTLTVGSCKSDPFADVHGTPAAVVTDFSYLQLPIGGTAAVKASIVDATATPLAVPITFTPCTGDVTVATDTSYHPIPATSARVIVTAVTANPSCVVVGGGGVKDTIQVAVLPQAFAGAFSSATPKGGDTLTISSTSLLKFDTTKVGVIFSGAGSDDTGIVVSKTPDAVKVLVPFGAAGPLTIAGIAVTYVPKLVVTFPTTNTVTQTGDLFATNDTSYATAPTIPLPAAAGTSVKILTDFDADNGPKCAEFGPPGPNTSIGPCVIYKFTLAAPTTLKFTTGWSTTGDMDTYVCGSTGLSACFESGSSGAGASNPESITTFTYAAGTHYFVVEQFRGPKPTNIVVTITQP